MTQNSHTCDHYSFESRKKLMWVNLTAVYELHKTYVQRNSVRLEEIALSMNEKNRVIHLMRKRPASRC